MNKVRAIFCLLLLTLLSACGGGSEGTGVYTTGLTKTLRISELSNSQVESACSAYTKFFTKFFSDPSSCYIDGLAETRTISSSNQAQNQCEIIVQECSLDLDLNDTLKDLNPCDLQSLETRNCNATVAQYEACVNERSAKLGDLLDSLSCQEAGNQQYYNTQIEDFFGEAIFSGPSCREFVNTCNF
ncbi:hypothetical protein JNK13_03210 [bacterium]|nr:hypothetical protein [bacterium]